MGFKTKDVLYSISIILKQLFLRFCSLVKANCHKSSLSRPIAQSCSLPSFDSFRNFGAPCILAKILIYPPLPLHFSLQRKFCEIRMNFGLNLQLLNLKLTLLGIIKKEVKSMLLTGKNPSLLQLSPARACFHYWRLIFLTNTNITKITLSPKSTYIGSWVGVNSIWSIWGISLNWNL